MLILLANTVMLINYVHGMFGTTHKAYGIMLAVLSYAVHQCCHKEPSITDFKPHLMLRIISWMLHPIKLMAFTAQQISTNPCVI